MKDVSVELTVFLESGYRLEKPTLCPDSFYSLMYRCWDKDKSKRPKFKEIVKEIESIVSKE